MKVKGANTAKFKKFSLELIFFTLKLLWKFNVNLQYDNLIVLYELAQWSHFLHNDDLIVCFWWISYIMELLTMKYVCVCVYSTSWVYIFYSKLCTQSKQTLTL